MSLTDDTNCQTIDIPLPEETDNYRFNNNESNIESTNRSQQEMTTTSDTSSTTVENNINSNQTIDQSLNPSLQSHSYNPYYYYSSAYNMSQVMPQSYPYYVPVVQPLVPVLPSLQHSIQAQNHSNISLNNINSKGDVNYGDNDEEDDDDSEEDPTVAKKPSTKASNILPIHCNDKMGLNPLIYTNIQQSPYFKNSLFQLKTYHEVIDEIYYSVKHLEPWEKGSRKIGGQTGMCGSVRGVGAGGIISTPFCILFKLFTIKLTRKQVNGLIRHKDSPFIRALGFMYIRFTQPPQHLFQWFEGFLEDEEVIDPKAGGGQPMTIGQMCRHMLTKLDWFSTLFPRVPVPIQKDIESKLKKRDAEYEERMREERGIEDGEVEEDEEEEEEEGYRRSGGRDREKYERRRSDSRERRRSRDRKRSHSRDKRSRSRDEKRSRSSDRSNDKHKDKYKRSRSPHSPHSHRHSRGDNRERERTHHRHRHRN